MTNFESVRKFMETFGQEIKEKAEFPDEKITSLRHDLIKEELDELKLGIIKKDQSNIEEEIGDLLITIVNLSRFLNISSELALKKANKKFYRRFTNLEKLIFLDKKIINDLSLNELMKYWKRVKNEEK